MVIFILHYQYQMLRHQLPSQQNLYKMNILVYFTPIFDKKFKRYKKKYQSIESDLKLFIDDISSTKNIDLGGGVYKYRLFVKSKNKGKSGG